MSVPRPSHLTTHDDAIDALRERGVPASRHVGPLGDTVVVPLGVRDDAFEPERHPDVAWLVPIADGAWDVVQLVARRERRRRAASLDAAIVTALELDQLFKVSEPCGRCDGIAELSFGEATGTQQFTFYVSKHCPRCGPIYEMDGGGSLDDELREIELARHGTWALHLRSGLSPREWSVVRQELGLDLAGVARWKRLLPGEILRGTIGEVSRLQARLARDQVETEVVAA